MVLFLREMRSSSFLWLLWTRIKEWNSTPDTVRPHWDAAADTPEILAEQACCVDLLWIEDSLSVKQLSYHRSSLHVWVSPTRISTCFLQIGYNS